MKTKPRSPAVTTDVRSPLSARSLKERVGRPSLPKQSPKSAADSPSLASHHVLPYDHEKLCPRFCALVCRDPEEDPCTIDELDPLQLELEQVLLHNIAIQKRVDNALKVLDGKKTAIKSDSECYDEPSTSGSSKVNGTASASAPIRLKLLIPAEPETNGTGAGHSAMSPSARFGVGRRSIHFWPQNNMPDKFWTFVSGYCAEIQQSDINFVKELYQESSEEKFSHLFKVPGLGKHYSLRWNEEGKSSPNSRRSSVQLGGPNKRKIISADNSESEEELGSPRSTKPPAKKMAIKSPRLSSSKPATNGMYTCTTRASSSESNLGTLTERLVQALIEENNSSDSNATNSNDKQDDIDSKDINEMNGMCSPNRALIKSLNLGNVAALERRIRKELKEQGLLDEEDETEASGDEDVIESKQQDEVSAELVKRQEELKSVMASNRVRLQALEKRAQTRIHQQSLQQLTTKCDNEIDNLCSKFYNLVPKRKPCNKKERDLLQKALKDRQKVVNQLDAACSSAKEAQ